jgi:hypothetical protein
MSRDARKLFLRKSPSTYSLCLGDPARLYDGASSGSNRFIRHHILNRHILNISIRSPSKYLTVSPHTYIMPLKPSVLLPLLSITALVQGLPTADLDSPALTPRATNEKVTGSVASSASGSGGSGTAGSSYTMYTGDGSNWPTQQKWIGSFEQM